VREIFRNAPFDPLVEAHGVEYKKLCFGDEFNSHLDLAKRFQLIVPGEKLDITPTTVKWPAFDPSSSPYDQTIQIIRQWYMFCSGGLMFKLVRTSENHSLGVLRTSTMMETIVGTERLFERQGTTIEDTGMKPSMEVTLPYQENVPFYQNEVCPVVTDDDNTVGRTRLSVEFVTLNTSVTGTGTYDIYSAVKDDFTMAWPEGPPIMFYQLTPHNPGFAELLMVPRSGPIVATDDLNKPAVSLEERIVPTSSNADEEKPLRTDESVLLVIPE